MKSSTKFMMLKKNIYIIRFKDKRFAKRLEPVLEKPSDYQSFLYHLIKI